MAGSGQVCGASVSYQIPFTCSPHTTENSTTAHWTCVCGRAEIPLRAAVAHMVTLQGAISLILRLHHTRMQEAGLFRGWQQFHVFKMKGPRIGQNLNLLDFDGV